MVNSLFEQSLFERWYGGLWAGAIGGAIAQADWRVESSGESPTNITQAAQVQDLILSGDRVSDFGLEGGESVAMDVAFQALRQSSGDWTIAFPWAMQRSPNLGLTGVWLGTLIGMNGGSRSIPIGLRVTYRDLGIQLRPQAEARVRSYSGVGAIVMPILVP